MELAVFGETIRQKGLTKMTTEQTTQSSFFKTLLVNRQQVAIGLGLAGVILAACAIWWGIWGFKQSDDTAAKPTPESQIIPIEEKKAAEETKADAKPRKSPDYQVACIWAGSIALLSLLSAAWLIKQPPDAATPETAVRVEVLTFGGTAGFLTTLAGCVLGYSWRQSLVKWVGAGDSTEAKWVLYASAIFIAGLMIMFVSLQLARTEQRANATLRRVLYGFNSVFTGLLVLLVLIVINVIAFLQVPQTLVANDAAFIELSDQSKTFLRSLDRPVKAYLILPEHHVVTLGSTQERAVEYENLYTDCHGLLSQCEDQSRNFHAEYLSPGLDPIRVKDLLTRFNIRGADPDRQPLGLLVTVGEDESVHTFIPAEELLEVSRRENGVIFQGEHRLMTELSFLVDSRSKEKVYFTTGHGELSIEAGGDPARSASRIVAYLRERKINVESLNLSEIDSKVPDDAAMVVVAGPQQTIVEKDPMLAALREFVRRSPRPGKLILMLPAHAAQDGRVAPTGLESLLAELGVDVDSSHRIVSGPEQYPLSDRRFMPQSCVLVGPFARADVTLARALGKFPLVFQDTRPLKALEPTPGSKRKVTPLLGTALVTWLEESFKINLLSAWEEVANDRTGAIRARKQVHPREAFPVAVAITESTREGEKTAEKPRAIIFGSDSVLIDQPPVPSGIDEVRAQFFSDNVDWLRERDASIGIAPRKLPIFILEKKVEWSTQAMLVFMICIGIGVVGGGVWLSRRR